eukprot:CAMPEP_0168719052 /NCGR_PEP_ID=MMETSP0724-20121128/838_1 /TAXON_ID=265536 /ORGANISM="Amphiprora sp., Strain CCMP467" /LENGTH=225 /DNA_ID=CAMNT_0008765591 /DNA_START=56 /DNA_END=736 /DNA_ORIENTATION=-
MEEASPSCRRRSMKMPTDIRISVKSGGRWNESGRSADYTNRLDLPKPKTAPLKSVSFALDKSGRPLCTIHKISSNHRDAFSRSELWWNEMELSPSKRREEKDSLIVGSLRKVEECGGIDSLDSLLGLAFSSQGKRDEEDISNASLIKPVLSLRRRGRLVDLGPAIPPNLLVPSLDEEQHNRLPLNLGKGSGPEGTAMFWTRGDSTKGSEAPQDSPACHIVAAYSA